MKGLEFIFVFFLLLPCTNGAYAPTGCTFAQGTGKATCDFVDWNPPLVESQFGPGDVYEILVENVDGTIPSGAFSGIDVKTNTSGKNAVITFKCDLENIILSEDLFTDNLNWIEELVFDGCYIQDGISSFMLSNMTSLQKFEVKSGIIGPLTSDSFGGLTSLRDIIIDADFLESDLPSGLFSGLPDLDTITLKSAGLSSIPADTFYGLDQLTDLDLSENSLKTLPEGLFQSLTSLTNVELGTNDWNCTCDMSWLSTWSLLTGVSVDVQCSSPSNFVGISLNRAVATLGCLDSFQVATTVASGSGGATAGSGSGSSDSGSSSSGSDSSFDNTLTYVALAIAGVACLVAIGISIAMCCRSNASSMSPGKTKVQPKKYNHYPETTSRPPSYRSSERMFVQTPVEPTRHVRRDPYIDVKYHP